MNFVYLGDKEDLNKSGIYSIVNLKDNKQYIGSAVNIKRRANYHYIMLNKLLHSNKHLQSAFNRDGKEYFEFKIIEVCNKKECLILEQKYLDKIFNLNDHSKYYYNIARDATSPMLGLKLSKEACKKVSEASSSRRHTVEAKEKNRQAHLGKKHKEESKNKITQALLGVNNPRYISPIQAENIFTGEKIIKNTLKEISFSLSVSIMTIHNRINKQSKLYTLNPVRGCWVISRIDEENI